MSEEAPEAINVVIDNVWQKLKEEGVGEWAICKDCIDFPAAPDGGLPPDCAFCISIDFQLYWPREAGPRPLPHHSSRPDQKP